MFGTNTFTGPAAYTNEKKFHKLAFTDITKGKVEPPPAANDGWIAMVQHYFVSAWLLRGDPDWPRAASYTVSLQHLPPALRDEAALKAHLETLFQGSPSGS